MNFYRSKKCKNLKKKSTLGVEVAKTFLLRGIDSQVLSKKYESGHFATLSIPKAKVDLIKGINQCNSNVGLNCNSEFYQFVDKLGEYRTVITTNHGLYKQEAGERIKIPCTWCRDIIEGDSVGLPIAMTRYEDRVVFEVDDHFCCFECAYTFLKRYKSSHRIYKDHTYVNAEQLLICMYKRVYPNADRLHERLDWRLYERNGGPFSKSQYHSNSHKYHHMNNIIINQAKRQYHKI